LVQSEVFEQAFKDFGVNFGDGPEAVYTPALVLWALVSQALFKGEQRSCCAAVDRIAKWWAARGRVVEDTNSGAYCRARQKIPSELIASVTRTIAHGAEQSQDLTQPLEPEEAEERLTPEILATVRSKPVRGRLFLIDGLTVDAADTPENQAEYPQNPAQQEGLGFPLLRCVALISLATGMVMDLAVGPYSGKESGETALLRQLADNFREGDILIADSYYCSYWLLAMCRARGVEVVMKNHHRRDDHPPQAEPICKHQRKVVWKRPARPEWMTPEEYAAVPQTMEIRLVDVQVDEAGFRTEQFTVATTIMDHQVYDRQWIASLYRTRWLVELDIRAIKCSLGMETLRSKTPAMVRTELWSCLLAYNLVRLKMLQSSIVGSRDVRGMSFTKTMVTLGNDWLFKATIVVNQSLMQLNLAVPLDSVVGNRKRKAEPRANKRRPKVLRYMTMSRKEYHAQQNAA
jgi:hypothetical protein